MEAAAKLEAEREKRKADEKSRLALEEKKRELVSTFGQLTMGYIL